MKQVDKGGHGDKNQPEPYDEKYLLVEEVDRQDTLNRVAVNVGLLTYLEVTERDPWEPFRQRPVDDRVD